MSSESTDLLGDVVKNLLTDPAFLDIINKQIIASQEKIARQVEINRGDIHDLSNKVSNSAKELERCQTKMKHLENTKQKMERDLNNLEQYTRRNSIRVFGIPEEANENTNDLIKDLSQKNLGITLTDSDLDRTHRVGPKNEEGGPRAIIAKFSRHDMKNSAMKACRNLKDPKW